MILPDKIKAAVVQATPVLFDRDKSIGRAVELIHKAAESSPDLILFPEAFIPGYPRNLSFGTKVGSRSSEGKELYELYYRNSVVAGSSHTSVFCELAEKYGAFISLGVSEQFGRSLYCSQLLFSPAGKLAGIHRKIKPTASERIIWGEGDGSTLTSHRSGNITLGTLICWENYMPLARMALYNKGVNIYLAPTADNRESWQHAIRHIASEGRCFVLACNQFVRSSDYPDKITGLDNPGTMPDIVSRGGSAIISPDGEYLAGPVWDREDILFAELDSSAAIRGGFDFEPSGHYNRPDIFTLAINGQPETGTEEW